MYCNVHLLALLLDHLYLEDQDGWVGFRGVQTTATAEVTAPAPHPRPDVGKVGVWAGIRSARD